MSLRIRCFGFGVGLVDPNDCVLIAHFIRPSAADIVIADHLPICVKVASIHRPFLQVGTG
jgi:hypothetical protein